MEWKGIWNVMEYAMEWNGMEYEKERNTKWNGICVRMGYGMKCN